MAGDGGPARDGCRQGLERRLATCDWDQGELESLAGLLDAVDEARSVRRSRGLDPAFAIEALASRARAIAADSHGDIWPYDGQPHLSDSDPDAWVERAYHDLVRRRATRRPPRERARDAAGRARGDGRHGRIRDCRWQVDDQGLLTVEPACGTGSLHAWENVYERGLHVEWPWQRVAADVRSARIGPGIAADGSLAHLLSRLPNLASADLSGLDASGATSLAGLFDGDGALTEVRGMDGWDVRHVADASRMLAGCRSLQDASWLAGWDVRSLGSVRDMLEGTDALASARPVASWRHAPTEALARMVASSGAHDAAEVSHDLLVRARDERAGQPLNRALDAAPWRSYAPEALLARHGRDDPTDFAGVYVIEDLDTSQRYVGCSSQALWRARQHMTSNPHHNDGVWAAFRRGDRLSVRVLALADTGVADLRTLEAMAIDAYCVDGLDFNEVAGHRTPGAWDVAAISGTGDARRDRKGALDDRWVRLSVCRWLVREPELPAKGPGGCLARHPDLRAYKVRSLADMALLWLELGVDPKASTALVARDIDVTGTDVTLAGEARPCRDPEEADDVAAILARRVRDLAPDDLVFGTASDRSARWNARNARRECRAMVDVALARLDAQPAPGVATDEARQLTDDDLGEVVPLPRSTWARLRREGDMPDHVMVDGRPVYTVGSVKAWLRAHRVSSGAGA